MEEPDYIHDDQLRSLKTEEVQTHLQSVEDLLYVTDDDWAPDNVVFKIDPLPAYESYVWFGEIISFCGYDSPKTTMTPDYALALTLYWMSVLPSDADQIVLAHISDDANQSLVAQQDGPPG